MFSVASARHSVILSTGEGLHHTGSLPSAQPPPPPDIFKLVQVGPHYSDPPFQMCSKFFIK